MKENLKMDNSMEKVWKEVNKRESKKEVFFWIGTFIYSNGSRYEGVFT